MQTAVKHGGFVLQGAPVMMTRSVVGSVLPELLD